MKNKDTLLKILIIGGLSAGPSAATRARRLNPNAEIHLFEKTAHISYATCGIPYAVSGVIPSLSELNIVHPTLLENRFNIRVHLNEAVTAIDPKNKTIQTEKGSYSYDKLIYAAGASLALPPIPGLKDAKNASPARSLEDAAKMSYRLKQDTIHAVTILGGGLIGVEMAENIEKLGKKVTLIEGGPQLLAPFSEEMGAYAKLVLQHHNIDVKTNITVTEVKLNSDKITKLILSDQSEISTDYVVISTGIKPNTELLTCVGAKALPNGAIIVTEKMETSLPDIYAAGDCAAILDQQTQTYTYLPLGTHSNKGGRCAGSNASGKPNQFKGGYKTAIVQICDHTFARTGYHPESLKKEAIPFKTTSIIASATASYYPSPESLWLQIYYHTETGRLLGAEAAGKVGVDKRIDVLSTAIYAKLTIDDLSELDLAYAPPYSPAKDPVVVAAFVAQNERDGLFQSLRPKDAADLLNTTPKALLIDVRTQTERLEYGTIPLAKHIPLDTLSEEDIPENTPTIIYCQKGLRGYLGIRKIGKPIYNLAGGYEAWVKSGFKTESVEEGSLSENTLLN